ncbi:MAG: patatin-like phospholipase family protein [Thermaceae bacterium]|nr:patatin-like phospholipase family protein [Thermaceae bacterium]
MDGIILALGGGGVRGAAHNAVLDVLSAANIPIVGLAGSSAGALSAAVFAFGLKLSPSTMSDWLKDPDLERLQKSGVLDQIGRYVDFVRRPYLAEAKSLRQGLRTVFGEARIEDSPIPLAIQATDLHTGDLVNLRAGPVAEALAASSAVPSIFPPVLWHGRLLVDGDVAEKVPITAAKSLGPYPIVAVDISNKPELSEPKSALEAALWAGEASRRRLMSVMLEQAAVVITLNPDEPIETFDYTKSDLAYELGKLRAKAALPQIQGLIQLSEPAPVTKSWWRLWPSRSQTQETQTITSQTQHDK